MNQLFPIIRRKRRPLLPVDEPSQVEVTTPAGNSNEAGTVNRDPTETPDNKPNDDAQASTQSEPR